jgi:hypothetical protein
MQLARCGAAQGELRLHSKHALTRPPLRCAGVASLHFPAEWPKEDRARAHRAAEARGLVSRSAGVGPSRRLSVLSPAAADKGAFRARAYAFALHATEPAFIR